MGACEYTFCDNGSESGCADSAPRWGELRCVGVDIEERDEDAEDEDDEDPLDRTRGVPSGLVGSSWIAASTFLVWSYELQSKLAKITNCSNSSWVIFDKDVWSIDSINCTAPICERRLTISTSYEVTCTYQARQIVSCFAPKLVWISKSIDEPDVERRLSNASMSDGALYALHIGKEMVRIRFQHHEN